MANMNRHKIKKVRTPKAVKAKPRRGGLIQPSPEITGKAKELIDGAQRILKARN